MTTDVNTKGDDTYFIRLLSFLQKNFKGEIIKFIPIRQSVFYLETKSSVLILKGYHSNGKLTLQETFMATLKAEGFHNTYKFLVPPGNDPLYFEGLFFGCIEYLYPHQKHFSYGTHKELKEGLELLDHYHFVTSKIINRYKTILPFSTVEQKWQGRSQQFIQNFATLKYFLKEQILIEMINWANWSLHGMEKYGFVKPVEPFVILHGDVAHHNFLRDRTGQLNLLDFDLISMGTPKWDILQYANRILPFLGWSLNSLTKYEQVQKYMGEKAFLYALGFPADIFREWNRIIKDKTYLNLDKLHQIINLTLGQFYMRQQFVQDLKYLMENNKN